MPTFALASGPAQARAFVFDKDGVLVDFGRYWGAMTMARLAGLREFLKMRQGRSGDEIGAAAAWHEAEEPWQDLAASLGYPGGSVDPTGPLVLATRFESAAVASAFLYRRGLTWVEARDAVRQAFDQAEGRVGAGALAECPGAREVLRALHERGWRIGVATTDAAEHAWSTLERLQLAPFVHALAGGDEVSRGKPHPDMLELVCARLGVAAREAIVVGDGINDLEMARSGRARAAIGVLTGVSTRQELAPAADLVLADLSRLLAACSP